MGKLLASEILQEQAADKSEQQFANSPDLRKGIEDAIMAASRRLEPRQPSDPAVSPAARAWRIADAAMLLLFTLGAFVQLNDPDPARWIAVYALAAAACLLSLVRRLRWPLPALLGAVALAWAATLAPRVVGRVPFRDMFGAFEMRSVGIEESREMCGLLIIAAWMAVLAVRTRPAAARERR